MRFITIKLKQDIKDSLEAVMYELLPDEKVLDTSITNLLISLDECIKIHRDEPMKTFTKLNVESFEYELTYKSIFELSYRFLQNYFTINALVFNSEINILDGIFTHKEIKVLKNISPKNLQNVFKDFDTLNTDINNFTYEGFFKTLFIKVMLSEQVLELGLYFLIDNVLIIDRLYHKLNFEIQVEKVKNLIRNKDMDTG